MQTAGSSEVGISTYVTDMWLANSLCMTKGQRGDIVGWCGHMCKLKRVADVYDT